MKKKIKTDNYIIKAYDNIINEMPKYITPEQIAQHAKAEKERMDIISNILIAAAFKPKNKTL